MIMNKDKKSRQRQQKKKWILESFQEKAGIIRWLFPLWFNY